MPTVRYIYYTGRRFGEVAKITWSMVSADCTELTIPDEITKTGRPSTIPLVGPLEPIAKELREMRKSFPKPTDRVFNVVNFRMIWNRACHNLGLGVLNPKTRTYTGLHPHDFRRSAARNLIKAGVTRQTAMKITGHETENIFDRYAIQTGYDIREALIRVGNLKGSVADIGGGKVTTVP